MVVILPFDYTQGKLLRCASLRMTFSKGHNNIDWRWCCAYIVAETYVDPFDCVQGRCGAKYKGVDSRLRGNDSVVVPTTAKQELRNNTYGIKLRS